MQVVYRNGIASKEPPHIHKCSVCDRDFIWNENAGYFLRFATSHDKGIPFDWMFVICSQECRLNAEEPFINQLGSQGGWSRKKAEMNWHETKDLAPIG